MVRYLIFIQFAVLILLFTFILKSDNDETDEDVDHEEGDDDDVDEVIAGYERSEVVHRPLVFFVRIYGHVQQTGQEKRKKQKILNNNYVHNLKKKRDVLSSRQASNMVRPSRSLTLAILRTLRR